MINHIGELAMNYIDALNYIHSTPKFSRILGNELLKKLLAVLNNPEKSLKFVHIAGTNGKGSTAAMTASVLKKAGYKTGLFTSPFIEKFNERIQINNVPIPDIELAKLTSTVKNAIEENDAYVSEFALITAIAFLYFARENCDIVILETGLGGKLDATNVIENPLLTVITSISLDHTEYLGDTLEKITAEKCGIIKENIPTVLYPIQDECVFETVGKFCESKSSKLIIPDIPTSKNGVMEYKNKSFSLSLKGSYQINNASVVIEIVKLLNTFGFNISEADLKYGLSHTEWIARFEFLTPDLIIDGSHNPDGVKLLKHDLLSLNQKTTLIIAMMSDKEYSECIKHFSEITDSIIITKIDMPRCCAPDILAEEFKKYNITPIICEDIKNAIETAKGLGNLICVCGSLYLAGYVRQMFNLSNIQ